MNREIKLTSIKLQTMVNLKDLGRDLWCPVLRFGRKKENSFRFPVVFNNYHRAQMAYHELEKFIGMTKEEVEKAAEPIYDKFKQYDYNN